MVLWLFQMYDRAISAPTSPTRLGHSGKRSWEEPNWMGSPRLLNKDMKTGLSRSLQTLPTDSSAFDTGERAPGPFWDLPVGSRCYSRVQHTSPEHVRARHRARTFFLGGGSWEELTCLSLLPWQIHSARPSPSHWPGRARWT